MTEIAEPIDIAKLPKISHGTAFPIMPIPLIEHNAEWFEAGPVTFAVEARVLGEAQDGMSGGGGSIHVFSADRSTEWVRFDCFDSAPHYHYLNHTDHQNVVWGYDEGSNGPMAPWALAAIRDRLPGLLRSAGSEELAARVEAEGFDRSVLARMEEAVMTAYERTLSDGGILAESQEWFDKWKMERRTI